MSKINVEEILQKHSLKLGCYLESYGIDHQLQEMLKAAIKEIVEQVVDRCADNAKLLVQEKYYAHEFHYDSYLDKQSILKVKEEISYE
jgi:hypothetical protein